MIALSGECVIWPGYTQDFGYGLIRINGRRWYVHRLVYQMYTYGPMPQVVRHLCHNTSCCNFDHLRGGTPADNTRDMMEAGRNDQGRQNGEANGNSALTASDVLAIRASDEPTDVLSDIYSVSKTHILRIKNRQSWRHMP